MAEAEAAITITARDRATGQFRKLEQASMGLGRSLRGLLVVVRRMATGFVLLQGALIGIPALLAALVTATTAINLVKFEQASRRARIQLQLLGLSALDARHQVSALAATIDRSAAVSILSSVEAMDEWRFTGFQLGKQLLEMTEEFAKLTGLDPAKIFTALSAAFTMDDVRPFAALLTSTENFAQVVIRSKDDILGMLTGLGSTENLASVERLAESMHRLTKATEESREAITTLTAAFLDVFVRTLADKLEAASERIRLAIVTSLVTAFVLAGRSMAVRFGASFGAGLAFILLTDVSDTVTDTFENPEFLAAAGIAAFLAGRIVGGRLIAGLVFVLVLELMPAIQEQFRGMSTPEQAEAIAFPAGIALGLALKLGLLRAFTLGLILQEAVGVVFKAETISHKGLLAALTGLGAAIGFAVAGPIGAGIGAFLGVGLFEFLRARGWLEMLLGGFGEMARKAADRFVNDLKIRIGELWRGLVDFIGNLRLPAFNIPSFSFPRLPGFEHGGTVPGPIGAPVPIIAHGGERFLGSGGGGAPIIVQLVLDRRVIGEVAVDAINRTARFKASMVPGSLGS